MNKSTDTDEESSFDKTQSSTTDSEGLSSSSLEPNNIRAENVNSDTGSQEKESSISNSGVTRAQALVKSKASSDQFKDDLGTFPKDNASFSSDNSHSSAQQSCESPFESSMSPDLNLSMSEDEDMQMEVDDNTEALAVVQLEQEQEAKRKEEMKKEQDRLEEEQRVFNDMLDCATKELRAQIQCEIECWIKAHINLDNYTQLKHELSIKFNNCPTIPKVPLQLRPHFVEILKDRCNSKFQKTTSKIINATDGFKTKITEYFSNHCYLPEDSLQQVLLTEYHTISNQLAGQFIRTMFQQILLKFCGIYVQHNQIISSSERALYEIVNDKLASFYNKEMGRYLAEGPYSPQMVIGIHENLVLELEDHYVGTLKFSSANVNNDVLQGKQNLTRILQQAFVSHLTNNELKLKELNLKTSKIIRSCKNRYVGEMEQFLSNNPDGVSESKLQDEHDLEMAKMMNILEAKLQLEVRHNEPVQVHAKVLNEHARKYFKVLIEANRKNLEKARDKKKDSSESKLESTETLERMKNENIDIRAPPNSTVTNSNSNAPTAVINKQGQLPPLVLEFKDCSYFVMAITMDGENKRLTNEFGESETKATVAFIHNEEKFIYGSQVLVKNLTSSSSIKRWDLCEYLISGKYESNEMVTVNRIDVLVSFEFVLGFILRKLKIAAEKQVHNKLSTAVITIPFWLSSTQRVQMRDGAKLAGFSDVYLVNEASAAAYACLSNKLWGKSNEALVVISANRNRVDTFVYQSSGGSTEPIEVKMLAHHNSCNNDKKQQNLLLNLINKAVAALRSSTDDCDGMRKSIRESIQESMKQAQQKAPAKFKSKNFLTICGSASKEWSEILDKVSTEFKNKVELVDAVLCGALVLSVDPEKIVNITDLLCSEVYMQSIGGTATVVAIRRGFVRKEVQVDINQIDTQFFQKIELGTRICVGTLSVENLRSHATVVLEVDNEGVIKCKQVSSSAMSYRRAVTQQHRQACGLEQHRSACGLEFKWKTHSLTEERFTEVASWLDHLFPVICPQETELTRVKMTLLEKCMEMTEKIDSQVFLIKSNLIRGVVKDKIAEAKRFAEHQNSSLDDLRKQADVLDKLYDKYSKK